jgi:ribosome maturation factor RimP
VDLIGKVVEVGTAETTYIGKLVEVNEEEVYLEAEAGWIVVPIEKIAYIREAED